MTDTYDELLRDAASSGTCYNCQKLIFGEKNYCSNCDDELCEPCADRHHCEDDLRVD